MWNRAAAESLSSAARIVWFTSGSARIPRHRGRAPRTPGNTAARIARFHDQVEEVEGIPLQVRENTASAGDVILLHSLLLHAAAPAAHLGSQPRFMLSRGFAERYW